jgi:DNA-binding PadR family transcriptional regulator
MSGTFTGGSFTADDITGGLRDAVEQLRGEFERRFGQKTAEGNVRETVLKLLAEGPMNGSQIIHEAAERSGGAWTPSAAAVYPTLQLLVDEGLATAKETAGRKTYTLTDDGKKAAEAVGTSSKDSGTRDGATRDGGRGALPKAGFDLAQATATVGRTGTPEQVKQAVAVLDEARRKLFSILAQD